MPKGELRVMLRAADGREYHFVVAGASIEAATSGGKIDREAIVEAVSVIANKICDRFDNAPTPSSFRCEEVTGTSLVVEDGQTIVAGGDTVKMHFLTARACRICRCTQNRTCMTLWGPCWWVAWDLCSACAEELAA